MMALLRAATLVAALMVGVADARTVRWAASGDPNTMDPHSQNVGTVTMVLQQIYDSLIARNQQLGLEPGLATAWTQEEPTRWRFTLRAGVRFHEGEAFTSDDVVFSITRPQNIRQRDEMHTTRNTNGTGALRLQAREPDARTVLARNPEWWGWQVPGNNGHVTEIGLRSIALLVN